MSPTISPTHALPLPQNANHPTDVLITTLILEIQCLCYTRDHSNPSSSSSSPDANANAAALQTLIRQKLDRLQHQILKRAIRKLEERLDHLPAEKLQQQIETDDDDDYDDGALLPVPLKIGSKRVRARNVRNDGKRNNDNIEDTNMDPLERLERKVLEVQIYTSN